MGSYASDKRVFPVRLNRQYELDKYRKGVSGFLVSGFLVRWQA